MSKVHLPLFHSKFLIACAKYLMHEHGIDDIFPFAKYRGESFCATYDSRRTGDFPAFSPESDGWSFEGRNSDGGPVMLDVHQNGNAVIRSLDGESIYIDVRIESPEELGELIQLFTSIGPADLTAPKWASFPLKAIIEKLFLVIPRDGRDQLIPFNPKHLASSQPELWRALKILRNLESEPEKLNTLQFSCWADWVETHLLSDALPELIPPGQRDWFYSSECGLHSWRLHRERETEAFDVEPKLAIRISERHSPMFFHVFAQQSSEGSALLKILAADPDVVQSRISQTQVEFPSTLKVQQRLAFEFRALRQRYDDRHASLVAVREPVKQLIELYERRIRNIDLLHDEYLLEIEAMRRPLPFLLEYPLRRLARSDEPLDKVIRAQQLLTILLKSEVLLPLEEALVSPGCPETVQTLARELGGKSLSDGAWLDLLQRFRTTAAAASLSLPLFGQLLAASGEEVEDALKDLVAARNRFHHPPHDAKAIIGAFDKHLPTLTSFLRSCLPWVAFIIPQSLRVIEGKRFVRGLDLMGFDTEFQTREFQVKATLESFPNDKIIAMDSAGRNVVILGRFFTSKPVKASTIDIGIFDRNDDNQPCFEFVRGLGSDPTMVSL